MRIFRPYPIDFKRRLEKLERSAATPTATAKRRDVWDVVQILMPVISGVILAWVGWLVTGAVEAGFKREQLQLSQVKEMRDLIVVLVGKDVTKDNALPTALTLSAYGPPAVAPLLTVLTGSQDEVRRPAAEAALRALGLSHPLSVCQPLMQILRNRSGRVSWQAYAASIRLVGDIGCSNAKPLLTQIKSKLENTELLQLKPDFAQTQSFDEIAVDELKRDVTGSLRAF